MLKSDSIELLAVALAKFHAACPKIVKDTRNDFFKSRYADLGTILGIVNPVLAANDLSVVQLVSGENELTTMLVHKSGQYIGAVSVMRPVGVTPQALGSAITYQRRYAVAAILSLCIDDDDDGNAASATGSKPEDRPVDRKASKPETKPAETKPVEKLSEDRINEIMTKILAGTEGEMGKMESALSNLGVQGAITQETWATLASALLFRWYEVSSTPAALGVVANKVVGYRSKGLVSDEQFEVLKKQFADRTAALKG